MTTDVKIQEVAFWFIRFPFALHTSFAFWFCIDINQSRLPVLEFLLIVDFPFTALVRDGGTASIHGFFVSMEMVCLVDSSVLLFSTVETRSGPLPTGLVG